MIDEPVLISSSYLYSDNILSRGEEAVMDTDERAIQTILVQCSLGSRLAIDKLLGLAISGEIRDYGIWSLVHGRERNRNIRGGETKDYAGCENATEDNMIIDDEEEIDIYAAILLALRHAWRNLQPLSLAADRSENMELEKSLWRLWWRVLKMPEFDVSIAMNRIFCLGDGDFVDEILRQFLHGSSDRDYACFIHWLYNHSVESRLKLRLEIGKKLLLIKPKPISMAPALQEEGGKLAVAPLQGRRSHISPLLRVLTAIVDGLQISNTSLIVCENLIHKILLPLHAPNDFVEWRDQTPVIQEYHDCLIACMQSLARKSRSTLTNNSDTVVMPSKTMSKAGDGTDEKVMDEEQEKNEKNGKGCMNCGAVAPKTSLFSLIVTGILSMWPQTFNANTPKELLFLHELEKLLEEATYEEFAHVLDIFIHRFCKCLGGGGADTSNIRTMQQSLRLFRNDKVMELFNYNKLTTRRVMKAFLPALFRNGDLSWNPTVNKMTALALSKLKNLDEVIFAEVADSLCHESSSSSSSSYASDEKLVQSPLPVTPSSIDKADSSLLVNIKRHRSNAPPLPPSKNDADTVSMGPPSTLPTHKPSSVSKHTNSVAPTKQEFQLLRTSMPATSTSTCTSSIPTSLSSSNWRPGQGAPPVTITGVAPWAMNSTTASTSFNQTHSTVRRLPINPAMNLSRGRETKLQQFQERNEMIVEEEEEEAKENKEKEEEKEEGREKVCIDNSMSSDDKNLRDGGCKQGIPGKEPRHSKQGAIAPESGLGKLMAYIDKCLPDGPEEPQALREWNKLLTAPSPTLLPSLKFHDLVFGRDLGTGSFSTVRYARQIIREKSRDYWPEYAVKIISASKIQEENYQASVTREMAIMQLLSHPGIARLISSFRYTQSAYLVLEYASRGDLHTLLINCGGLSHLCTRFVIGEISAAILSIHELGFAYNDLKPENVLITETGHLKVADFGGCRPITQEACNMLLESSNILQSLRNGDLREAKAADGDSEDDSKSNISPTPSSSFSFSSGSFPLSSASATFSTSMMDDTRLESTPAYMPPEALLGTDVTASTNADAWALGCITSFCLTGKPPFFGHKENVIAQIYQAANSEARQSSNSGVRFNLQEKPVDMINEHSHDDGSEHSRAAAEAATAFVNALLEIDHVKRLKFSEAAVHRYLTHGYLQGENQGKGSGKDGVPIIMDPLMLHFGTAVSLPVIDAGRNSPKSDEDKLWARRQLSVLWAPMPSDSSTTTNWSNFDDPGGNYKFESIAETTMEHTGKFY